MVVNMNANTNIVETEEAVIIKNPEFTRELVQWVEEWQAEGSGNLVYDLTGKIVNASKETFIIDGDCDVVPNFKSNVPFKIREYLNYLVKDIEHQALTDRVCLYEPTNYNDECVGFNEIRKENSRLPKSVMEFWNATDVDYKFIYSLASLVENKGIAKLVLLGFNPFKEVSLSKLVLTSNYEGVRKELNSSVSWIYEMMDTKGVKDSYFNKYLRLNSSVNHNTRNWFELIKVKGNNLGYKYFSRYIIEEQKLDVETCKEKLIDIIAEKLVNYCIDTKETIKGNIAGSCLDFWNKYCPMNLYTMGYMYLQHNELLAVKETYNDYEDTDLKEIHECNRKLADDLYEDILLKMLHKAKKKEQ